MEGNKKKTKGNAKKTQFKASFIDLWQDPNIQNSKIWKHNHLTSLSFFACRMRIIPLDLLRKWRETIEMMSFSSNYLSEFPSLDGENGFTMPNLRAVDINNNEFQSFPIEFLNHCPNMKEINLSQNPLQFSEGFDEFPSIQFRLDSLNLSQCKLTEVPLLLNHFTHLTRLEIYNNKLESIPNRFFFTKRNLTELNVSKNKLEEWNCPWNDRDFGRSKLRRLDLSFNKISRISFLMNQLDSSMEIKEISVDDRRGTMRENELKKSQNINNNEENNGKEEEESSIEEEIEMGKGPDSEEENETASGPSWKMDLRKENLLEWKVSISETSTPRTSRGSFGENISFISMLYRSLRVLNVSVNHLESMDAFIPLLLHGSLEVLLLSMNKIRAIPQEFCGDSIKTLTWLDISHNRITPDGVPEGVFRKMNQLKHLSIQGNDFNNETPIPLNNLSIETFIITDHVKSKPSEIIEGKLFLGSVNCAQSFYVMKRLGITHIVSVIREHSPFYPSDFKYHVVEADDTSSFDISKSFDESHSFIEDALENGGVILVHCAAGVSRSATIVISYLMRKRRMSYQEAYNFVRKQRSIVCPNSGFRYQLERFEKQMNTKKDKCTIS
eukprot:TRINITY_DN44_c2_g1_i2.p1 TRINITY_DN44_c2_g1~~TRINITY_DN44_c2_g1_i2.p1  ORF type:complete len:611 (-),score=157.36 TRINITY_DN44_c2_g1_i2:144-1976(-)